MLYDEYAAVLVPSDHFGVVEGIKGDAVRAVPFQKRGVRAIELYTFSVHDGKGDQRSVVAFGFDFQRLATCTSFRHSPMPPLSICHLLFHLHIVLSTPPYRPTHQPLTLHH